LSYIGKTPTSVPLTSGDITDGIISTSKIADDAISAAKLASGVGGKVLQVVQASFTSQVSIASTSFTDTGITLAITPSATSSKILVMVSMQYTAYNDNSDMLHSSARIMRDSTGVFESQRFVGSGVGVGSNGYQQIYQTTPFNYLDSPNTTNATTYKVTVKNGTTGGNRQIKINSGSGISTITLTEVSA
tara:strand:+ start:182 stop:748 length:567 start_codon:yes stop_codon:yes gene_type:complete